MLANQNEACVWLFFSYRIREKIEPMYAKLFKIVFYTAAVAASAAAIRSSRTMRMVHSSHNLHSSTTNLCKNKISAKTQE